MRFTSITLDGTQAAYHFVPRVQLAGLGRRRLHADLHIHDQADMVVANKQARDTWEAKHAERVCGCPQCRGAYRETLAFYAALGTRQPARERVSATGLSWFVTLVSESQRERT